MPLALTTSSSDDRKKPVCLLGIPRFLISCRWRLWGKGNHIHSRWCNLSPLLRLRRDRISSRLAQPRRGIQLVVYCIIIREASFRVQLFPSAAPALVAAPGLCAVIVFMAGLLAALCLMACSVGSSPTLLFGPSTCPA